MSSSEENTSGRSIIQLSIDTVNSPAYEDNESLVITKKWSIESMLFYFKIYGAYPLDRSDLLTSAWTCTVLSLFILFVLGCVLYIIYDLILFPKKLWWFAYLTVIIKCVCVAYATRKNLKRVEQLVDEKVKIDDQNLWEKSSMVSQKYYYISNVVHIIVISIYTALGIKGYWVVLYVFSVLLGTIGVTSYFALTLHFSTADMLLAKNLISKIAKKAKEQTLTFKQFIELRDQIRIIANNASISNGLVIGSILLNCVGAFVVLFAVPTLTEGKSILFDIGLVLFEITILLFSEILYLYYLLPAIAEIHEDSLQLKNSIANDVWSNTEQETERHNILLCIAFENVEFLTMGVTISKSGIRRGFIVIMLGFITSFITGIIKIYADNI